MNRSQSVRDSIFRDFKFYTKPDTHKVTTYQYQQKRGQLQYNTFRKKKQPNFLSYSYSSALNPFTISTNKNKNNYNKIRHDKPYKQTYQRKKRNQLFSSHYTNPIALIYQPPPKIPKVRPQHQINFGSRAVAEMKYQLPAARILSPTHKRYFCQSGFSYSHQKPIKTRQFLNSTGMRKTIQYSGVDHQIQRLTGKVGYPY